MHEYESSNCQFYFFKLGSHEMTLNLSYLSLYPTDYIYFIIRKSLFHRRNSFAGEKFN